MTLYLLSFLDRVNIGNSRLYGLEKDLNMTGSMFQTSVSVLFVTYLAFEIPSNLALKVLRPSRYLPAIAIAWGIIALCTGFVQSYSGLLACRFLLGAFEAGLFPGMTIYLTFFYTRKELALRVSYLFVSAALAGASGKGLLAYGIGHLDGACGMRGWRWIMILEGIPPIVFGLLSFLVLADDPENASYLTPNEKLILRNKKLRDDGDTITEQHIDWKDVRSCFLDWKVYAFAIAQFGVDTMLYGYSTFLPTIIQQIGSWSNPVTQALTIPCYCVGAVSYLLAARASDRTQLRGIYCVAFGLVSMIGYAILLSPVSNGARYFGCFAVACGLYTVVGIPLSWLPTNTPRLGKRAAASGFQLTLGNSAGIMTPFIYPTGDRPRFIRGHAVSLAMTSATTMSPNASGGYPEFPYTSQRDNALDYLRREANSSDGWTTFDNKDGVTYEKKSMPGDSSAIPLVRGKGVVEGFTPLQFLALITYPGVRTTWDTRTEHVEVRKRFGRHLTQFYAVQRGMGWIVSPRDIVGCQDTIYNEDGSVERVQTSVEDPDVPPVSGRVRATLTVAGWVLKPHEKGTDVTYLVKSR
ncbi:hypothetical protein FRB99_002417, partial [Tulasnella sp. 403]